MKARNDDCYRQGLALAAAGRHLPAIEAFERALQADPDDTRVLYALAGTAKALDMPRQAEIFYLKVLAREPARIEAAVGLANLYRELGRFGDAKARLAEAIAGHGETAELLLSLGAVLRDAGADGEAEAMNRKALRLRPGYVAAMVNLADILFDRGEADEAMQLYREALAREPNNVQARINRAVIHLTGGALNQGWQDYAARLALKGAPQPDHGLPRWDGNWRAALRLLVTAEQGIGDQVMFASMIPDLARAAAEAGGHVVFECEKRLVPLFARSFPDVTVHEADMESRGGTVAAHYGWLVEAGGADCFCEIGSLAAHLRGALGDFPKRESYLRADDADIARWREAFARLPRPLTGICWRSGKTGGHRAVNYAPLEEWAAFIRALPGSIVSLQYDGDPAEIARLEALSGRGIAVPENLDQKNEIDRTAGLIATLDRVATAPTAVSWLAAGLGVATVKILGGPGWTSFGTDHEPFAPRAVCVVPAVKGDWKEAFAIGAARFSA
jgi:Flp pilus assembly protein TadD